MVDAGCQCVYVVDSAGRADHGADRRPGRRARRRDRRRGRRSASTGTRTSASASPTRSSRPAPAPRRSTARSAASAPAPATRRSRRSSASATSSAGRTGVDFLKIVDAAEDVVRPAMPEECQLDRMTLMMGYAGVYTSFLKHAGNAGRALRRLRRQDPARGRPSQADRRPGGPADRHRADAEGRAGQGGRERLSDPPTRSAGGLRACGWPPTARFRRPDVRSLTNRRAACWYRMESFAVLYTFEDDRPTARYEVEKREHGWLVTSAAECGSAS